MPKKRNSLSALLLLIIVSFAASCAPRVSVPEKSSEEALNLSYEIKSVMEARQQCLKGFEAETEVSVQYPGNNYKTEALIIGWRPSFLRLECLGLFSQPLLSVATNGEHFDLLSVANMKCYEGSLSSSDITSYIPKGVSIQDLYSWLFGEYSFDARRPISVKPRTAALPFWVMEVWNEDTDIKEEIWFEPSEGLIRKVILRDGSDKPVITAENTGVIKQNGFSYPQAVSLRLPSGLEINIGYKMLTPLKDKPSRAFSICCPPGFKHKTLD